MYNVPSSTLLYYNFYILIYIIYIYIFIYNTRSVLYIFNIHIILAPTFFPIVHAHMRHTVVHDYPVQYVPCTCIRVPVFLFMFHHVNFFQIRLRTPRVPGRLRYFV